jgi:hypothetical protein
MKNAGGRGKNRSARKVIDQRGSLGYIWRLESMAFRNSYSVAGLALWFGACGCCLLVSQAGAGDKIEFSAPGGPLVVPQPQPDQKEKKISDPAPHLSQYSTIDLYAEFPSTPIIITNPRKHDKDAWNPLLAPDDDSKELSGFGSDSSDLLRGRKELSALKSFNSSYSEHGPEGMTNGWSRPKDWSKNSAMDGFKTRRDDRTTTQGEQTRDDTAKGSGRDDAANAFGRDDDHKQGQFAGSMDDSEDALPWTKDVEPHGSIALDRMRRGEFIPHAEDFDNESPTANGQMDGLRIGLDAMNSSPALPPSLSAFSSPEGDDNEGLVGVPTMPSAFSKDDLFSQSAGPYNPSPVPSWSGDIQKRAPQAVLAFPRRPGSLFQ